MTLSSHTQPLDDGTTVTGTIVFSGAPAADDTIVITDAAGTSRTFTAKGATTAASLEFDRTSLTTASAGMKLCIDHANGFNPAAGASITCVDSPAGTVTLTLALPGTYRFKDKAEINPADDITNTTVTDFGSGGGAEDIDGHTIAGGGNSAAPTLTATNGGWNSKTNNKSNVDLVKGRKMSGSKVIAKTGTATKTGVEKAHISGGTLAYNPQSRNVTLSTSDIGWLIRGGTATKLSGIAALDSVLSVPGSDTTSRRPNLKRSYRQKGTWADQVFDLHSGLLKQADGTDKADISGRGSLVDGGANRDLEGDAIGRAVGSVPGELVILFNFASYSTNMVDYSAING